LLMAVSTSYRHYGIASYEKHGWKGHFHLKSLQVRSQCLSNSLFPLSRLFPSLVSLAHNRPSSSTIDFAMVAAISTMSLFSYYYNCCDTLQLWCYLTAWYQSNHTSWLTGWNHANILLRLY
jgi:hypothetical protein